MSKLSDFTGGSGSIMRRQLFTADGTWTKPEGLIGEQVWVTMIGGGSSGNASDGYVAISGSSGQYTIRCPLNISSISSVPITIGSGGASTLALNAGSAGSVTSFGSLLSVQGGPAPAANAKNYASPINGCNSGRAYSGSSNSSTIPIFGAPIAESVDKNYSGGSGLLLDTTGITADTSASGVPGGQGYGAGGGLASNNAGSSGAGAPGAVLVEWLEKV